MSLSLPAFKSRNYRLFFAGQGLSLVGTWMTQVATIWLVYSLTQSPFWLGVIGFSSQVPSFFLVPFGGVLVDRWNKHHALIVTQILSMVQSLALAVLAFTGTVQLWHIVVLSLFQGLVNAFDAPTRQSFVPEIIEHKSDLPNAIALNSSMFNGARLLGPGIAGVMIAAVGASYCFLIDGLSYIAVIAALFAMRLQPKSPKYGRSLSILDLWNQFTEGFRYAFGFSPIRNILLLLALVSFMGMQYTVLAPIFATDILQGKADTLGLLMASSGLGALAAGVTLALRKSIVGLGRFIAIAPALMGSGLIVFALSKVVWLSVLAMALTGFGFLLQFASSNTIIQTIVDDNKRGRVMSLYIMAFMGMVPFGNLFGGSLASRIGAPTTLIISGVACIIGSILFTRQLPNLRTLVRPIYRQIGILPKTRLKTEG